VLLKIRKLKMGF